MPQFGAMGDYFCTVKGGNNYSGQNMDVSVNLVKSLVGDPNGDYKYLGKMDKDKRVVSYMFIDDTSTEDGMFLPVGTIRYYVVSGVECRLANEEEILWAMRSQISEILDEPNNQVDGVDIDIMSVLSKYAQQKGGYSCPDLTSYAGEDTGRSEMYWIEYRAWRNDGKPTGIESDEQFYELQRLAYGEILVDLD